MTGGCAFFLWPHRHEELSGRGVKCRQMCSSAAFLQAATQQGRETEEDICGAMRGTRAWGMSERAMACACAAGSAWSDARINTHGKQTEQ